MNRKSLSYDVKNLNSRSCARPSNLKLIVKRTRFMVTFNEYEGDNNSLRVDCDKVDMH